MNELDRRIAEEVMGEPEPEPVRFVSKDTYPYVDLANPSENWTPVRHGYTEPVWEPKPFSSSLEYVMKAMDKWLDAQQRYQELWLTLSYDRAPEARNEPWDAYLSDADDNVFCPEDDEYLGRYPGQTAPDAICNLLLALAELSKEKP